MRQRRAYIQAHKTNPAKQCGILAHEAMIPACTHAHILGFLISIFFISVFYKNIFLSWEFTEIYPGRPAAGRPAPGRSAAGQAARARGSLNHQITKLPIKH